MRRLLTPLLLALAIVAASPAAAFAADYYVAINGDDAANTGTPASPFATVQKAIDTAFVGGGNVYVGPGTFTGNITLKNGVSLYGAGSNLTTLTVESGRVVTISTIGAGETVSGFTITGGSAQQGGGIYIMSSSPTISYNVITGNTVTSVDFMTPAQGGGIFCQSGSPIIASNTIESNAATGRDAAGGGIALASSSATVRENTIRANNVASDSSSMYGGGGVHSRSGSPTLAGNVIADNVVTGYDPRGGGISLWRGAGVVTGNSITGNRADGVTSYAEGGGIYCFGATTAISGNLVANNTARGRDTQGAGIHFYAGFDVLSPVIADNTITGNRCEGSTSYGSAAGAGLYMLDGTAIVRGNRITSNVVQGDRAYGGGVYTSAFWNATSPVLTNNVIADNSLAGTYTSGSAIYCSSPSLRITNTTIAGNSLAPGALWTEPSVVASGGRYGSSLIITNSILWNNQPSQLSGGTVTFSCVQGGAAGAGNIAANPLLTAGYALTAGSPASDVASPTVAPATDIIGTARPQGAGFDMGAYEYTPTPSPLFDAVGDAYTVDEDMTLAAAGRGVLSNDAFNTEHMPVTAALLAEPGNGTVVLNADGSFVYTPDADWNGTDTFTYTATGRTGTTDSATVTITVLPVNDPPVLAPIGNKSVDELALLTFTATATDVDLPANTLTFSLGAGAPEGASINAATGIFSWTPTEAQGPGTFEITIIVSDGALEDSETFTVTVNEVNVAPVLALIGDKSVDELAPLVFTAAATDVDLPANTLTFSLGAGAPDGAAIDPATGVFSWTPTEAEGPGTFDITIAVSDGALEDSETITVTVTEVPTAPVLAPIGDKSTDELVLLTFTATATDADLPAETLTFSLGAGAPAGASIDAVTGVFTWTPTEAQGPGTFEITIFVSDGPLGDSETITVTVAEVNVAPALAPIGNKSINELALLTFTATATDADLPAQTLTFSLAPGAPEGASITAAGVFTWTPTEAQGPGVYPITIVVSDGILTDSETITVTVAEVAVPVPPVRRSGTTGSGSTDSAAEADPDAAAASAAGSDAAPLTATASASEGDEEASSDDPVTGVGADEPTDAEASFPWWVIWLLLALVGIGLFGWLMRRRRDAGEVS